MCLTAYSRHSRGESESNAECPATTSSTELDLSLDKITVGDDIPIIRFSKASMEESEELPEEPIEEMATPQKEDDKTAPFDTKKDGEASITTLKGDSSENEEKSTESEEKTAESEEKPLESEEKPPESQEMPTKSKDKPSEGEEKSPVKETPCPSCEALLSDEAVFLHVHVIPRPGMTYTYTPINNSMGIDIPKGQGSARNSRSPSVQQVKTCFCFAFVLKR